MDASKLHTIHWTSEGRAPFSPRVKMANACSSRVLVSKGMPENKPRENKNAGDLADFRRKVLVWAKSYRELQFDLKEEEKNRKSSRSWVSLMEPPSDAETERRAQLKRANLMARTREAQSKKERQQEAEMTRRSKIYNFKEKQNIIEGVYVRGSYLQFTEVKLLIYLKY